MYNFIKIVLFYIIVAIAIPAFALITLVLYLFIFATELQFGIQDMIRTLRWKYWITIEKVERMLHR